jgi:hypothetical protein
VLIPIFKKYKMLRERLTGNYCLYWRAVEGSLRNLGFGSCDLSNEESVQGKRSEEARKHYVEKEQHS